jgi:6-phosphogluconolactonase (cycloisomerase 2 family)
MLRTHLTAIALVVLSLATTSRARADHRHAESAVYTITNPAGEGLNAVEAYTRDPHSGLLTHLGRFPTGGTGDLTVFIASSHSLASNGRHLYVVNPGSDDITAFAIGEDGSLTRVGHNTPSRGAKPVSLTLHGDLLYVGNQGRADQPHSAGYSGFRVDPSGRLHAIPGSTISLEPGDFLTDVSFNPSGSRLVASRTAGSVIDTFTVSRHGYLINQQSLLDQPFPIGIAFSPIRPTQFFIGRGDAEPGATRRMASYDLPGTFGTPRFIGTTSNPSVVDPCWTVVSDDGKRLWASATLAHSITLFSIADNGQLTDVSSTFEAFGNASLDFSLDASSRYLYRLRMGDLASGFQTPAVPGLDVFELTSSTEDAGLKLVQSVSLPDDLQAASVVGVLAVDVDRAGARQCDDDGHDGDDRDRHGKDGD